MLQPRRARASAGAACLAVACSIAGCQSTASSNSNSSVTATGHTLVIYLSGSPGPNPVEQAVLSAEQAACAADRAEVTAYAIECKVVAAATPQANARIAIQNKSAVAYIGEITPGASENSVGITNALDLLQVSPTDTGLELTTPTSAVPKAPKKYFESTSTYGYTFARIAPDGSEEATALVAEMQSLRLHTLAVGDDGSDYGEAIAHAVSAAASGAITVSSDPSSADAYFYGSNSGTAAAAAFAKAAAAHPGIKLFGPSGLAGATFPSTLSNLYISVPTAATGVPASPARAEAPFGAEAVAAVISVLKAAGGQADDRTVVRKDFKAIANRPSPLGTYSIDTAGNSSLSTFQYYRLSSGSLVPVKPSQG